MQHTPLCDLWLNYKHNASKMELVKFGKGLLKFYKRMIKHGKRLPRNTKERW